MPKFTVKLQSQPLKFYEKTSQEIVRALNECFIQLEENPFFRPSRVKKLGGCQHLYRYRIGRLRVVYEINRTDHIVHNVAILPRGDVYKKI